MCFLDTAIVSIIDNCFLAVMSCQDSFGYFDFHYVLCVVLLGGTLAGTRRFLLYT